MYLYVPLTLLLVYVCFMERRLIGTMRDILKYFAVAQVTSERKKKMTSIKSVKFVILAVRYYQLKKKPE